MLQSCWSCSLALRLLSLPSSFPCLLKAARISTTVSGEVVPMSTDRFAELPYRFRPLFLFLAYFNKNADEHQILRVQ